MPYDSCLDALGSGTPGGNLDEHVPLHTMKISRNGLRGILNDGIWSFRAISKSKSNNN